MSIYRILLLGFVLSGLLPLLHTPEAHSQALTPPVSEPFSVSGPETTSDSQEPQGDSSDKNDGNISDDPEAKCPVISKVLFQPLFKPSPTSDPCVGHGTSLVTLTDIQRLYLCSKGKSLGSFDVALGRGGLDKRQKGDCKTPMGTYPLAAPRNSFPFFKFIPIGYPTSQQANEGYTGSAVGIHGPARWFDFLGSFNVSLNWTRGCIAVESPEAIDSIANFVRAKKVQVIKILAPDPMVLEKANAPEIKPKPSVNPK